MSAPELQGTSFFRYLWRQLTSMRKALILLLLLGLASIPGSLFPQRTQSPLKVREYFESDPNAAKWMDRFYLFDVYGSPWFSAIYILLFISLIGCVAPRTWHYAKEALSKPSSAPATLTQFEFHQESDGSLDQAETWLKKNRFRVTRSEGAISAEKGYLRETGNLIFHLALIVILLGVGASSVFGMRGEAIVTIGERFINVPTSYDNLAPGRFFDVADMPAFVVTAANFEAKYDPETRQPLDYKLTALVSNGTKDRPERKIVRVNKPLTFGDSRVYLQANGFSPLVTVRDKDGNVKFEGPVPFLPQDSNLTSIGAIKVPDMNPQIGFVASFFPTAARDEVRGGFSSYPELLDPRLLVSVWQGDLKMDSGIPQSVYRIDTSEMERIGLWGLSISESYTFGDPEVGTITLNGAVPWVNLQVVKDPGKPWALAGSIVAIASLMASLFIRQRRIFVRASNGKLEVAGLALNRLPGLEDEIRKMVSEVSR
jgi:cytochrome c biogenesis protein